MPSMSLMECRHAVLRRFGVLSAEGCIWLLDIGTFVHRGVHLVKNNGVFTLRGPFSSAYFHMHGRI